MAPNRGSSKTRSRQVSIQPTSLATPHSELTEPQSEILRFIKDQVALAGSSPSYREIQEHFGYKAVGTVQDHIKALLKKGALQKMPTSRGRRARGLVPAGKVVNGVRRIPIYGEIAAGSARDANQLEMGSLLISEQVAQDPSFALRVVGDSMIDAGIFEGDFLIVERRAVISSGDIVVALLNGETTVKRYVEEGEQILLVPANRRLSPIRVEGRFEIQGKVVGLQRRL